MPQNKKPQEIPDRIVAANAKKFKGQATIPPFVSGKLQLDRGKLSFTTEAGEVLFDYRPEDLEFVIPYNHAVSIRPNGQPIFSVAYDGGELLTYMLFADTATGLDMTLYNPKKTWKAALDKAHFPTKPSGGFFSFSELNTGTMIYLVIIVIVFGFLIVGKIINSR